MITGPVPKFHIYEEHTVHLSWLDANQDELMLHGQFLEWSQKKYGKDMYKKIMTVDDNSKQYNGGRDYM